jgi:hypothetical protein
MHRCIWLIRWFFHTIIARIEARYVQLYLQAFHCQDEHGEKR